MSKRGVTLIEMLVVVAIIAVLAAISVPQVADVLMKGRDARRKSDLNAIQAALESYYVDVGRYPQADCGWDCNGYKHSTSGAQWIPEIVPYLRGGVVAQDPANNAGGPWSLGNYAYAYGNVGRTSYKASYDLTGQLENTLDRDRCEVKAYKWYFSNGNWCTAWGGSYTNQIIEVGPLT